MDRALPEFNRVLHKKWQAHNKRLHKIKIHETRPLVDNSEPSSLKYPLIKTKKEQLLEDRCTEIEKANRILLEKMTNIMTSQPQLAPIPQIPVKKGQGQHFMVSSLELSGGA